MLFEYVKLFHATINIIPDIIPRVARIMFIGIRPCVREVANYGLARVLKSEQKYEISHTLYRLDEGWQTHKGRGSTEKQAIAEVDSFFHKLPYSEQVRGLFVSTCGGPGSNRNTYQLT